MMRLLLVSSVGALQSGALSSRRQPNRRAFSARTGERTMVPAEFEGAFRDAVAAAADALPAFAPPAGLAAAAESAALAFSELSTAVSNGAAQDETVLAAAWAWAEESPEAVLSLVLGAGTAVTMVSAGAWLLSVVGGAVVADEVSNVVYPAGRYDRFAAAAYFGRRNAQAVRRAVAIASPSTQFALALVSDKVFADDTSERRAARALTLVDTLVLLGPTFVKVGQALSIRSDLLPAEYCDALASLQDACPPFDNAEAKKMIAAELGLARLQDAFVDFGAEPVASASLGQVYKAHVRRELAPGLAASDDDLISVAVKVQRPEVLETIALDLHLLRVASTPIMRFFGLNTDLPGIVDAWGERFVDELDYKKEAANAQLFATSIANTPLAGAVFAPAPIAACSSSRVLTTQWVEGSRLDAPGIASSKTSALCSLAMNAYLTMMLETGLLHADPHPGNLIVEKATGRLAILDWGLVTELDSGLQLAYIEHIAHLVAKDYASVPSDLVKLGFVPEGYEDAIRSSDAVEVLSNVYTAFAGGGGAAKIDVPAVISELRLLANRQGNLFRLPPYFAYIARAFSVLEGIGLRNDPNYAIVGECLPYVSQRLLSDPNPRVAKALDTFIYGASPDSTTKNAHSPGGGASDDDEAAAASSSSSKRRPGAQQSSSSSQSSKRPRAVDTTRLTYLLDGFSAFSASDGPVGQEPSALADSAVAVAEKLAQLLLRDSADATPLQAIVETELAKLAGASARTFATRLRESDAGQVARRVLDPLGILEQLATGPLLKPDRGDAQTLATFDRIQRKATPEVQQAIQQLQNLPEDQQRAALAELSNILWQNRAGAAQTARRLGLEMLQQTADRLE